MSVLLLLRRTRGSVRHLEWKIRIFTVGAVVGLVGIYLEERWLTLGAVGLLVAGFALRFLPDARSGEDDRNADD